jgi:hypothetical protein
VSEQQKSFQISLSFLFQQVFWVAVLLALWRVFPRWEEPPPIHEFVQRLLFQSLILTGAGLALGALLGGWRNKVTRGAIAGLLISLPPVTAWLLYWLAKAAVVG